MNLPAIKFSPELRGKRVLLRLTLNVPIADGRVSNDFRLNRILPTLEALKRAGAKTIVISHLGKDGSQSLKPVADWLGAKFLADEDRGQTQKAISQMAEGEAVLLENLRRFAGEKENDENFARQLAELGEIFINEDFAASHREHASIVGIPKFLPGFFGPLFCEEVKNLSRVFKPPHPFVLILGGAKFQTKIPLVEKFLQSADKIFISGALANTFFKEMGYEVGESLTERPDLEGAQRSGLGLGTERFRKNPKVVLPSDVVAVSGSGSRVCRPDEVKKHEKILDVGPESVKEMIAAIKDARFVLWNGPFGRFEDGFSLSTEKFAQALAQSPVESIVGGGDTVAAIQKLNLLDKFSFVSTGGGAMLEFLARGSLPGIEAIQRVTKV